MAKLTGIDIYKLLPKTNCGDCQVPTCMAFAMQVAAKKAALEKCPHVSEQAKQALAESAEPPMRTVTIGTGPRALQIGGETVLFRHEEKFHRATGVALRVSDAEDVAKVAQTALGLHFIRAGKEVRVDLIALEQTQDAGTFAAKAAEIARNCDLPIVLVSSDPSALGLALQGLSGKRPLICGANSQNYAELAALAKSNNAPLAVQADSLDSLATLTGEIKKLGVSDLVLAPKTETPRDTLTKLTQLRRLALEKNFRALGFPVMVFTQPGDPFQETSQAITYVCKYAQIVVMAGREPWQVLPVLTARFNIFTDPQVPNAVEAKLYRVGDPGRDAPVIVTTNFALTYFTVEGEVENSKVPAYIAVVETNGLGVLNSYADDKLSGETIAAAVKKCGALDQVSHKKLVIPGLVAVLKGELEDESGCEVVVGPEEAAGLPGFLKNDWKRLAAAL
ncbi:MAG: acetyl-CoA decarbonylase/synthase complex subunit gamma [Acidobacteria bacterium]|nr:MAG: acetyl-CoA decarbonylase/synthase complex subunit gamma [Acidobacteriota bacterium]